MESWRPTLNEALALFQQERWEEALNKFLAIRSQLAPPGADPQIFLCLKGAQPLTGAAESLPVAGTFNNASRSTTRPLIKCSSMISATSAARTCAYQTPSG